VTNSEEREPDPRDVGCILPRSHLAPSLASRVVRMTLSRRIPARAPHSIRARHFRTA